MLLLMCLLLLIQDQTLSENNGWTSQREIMEGEHIEEAKESNIEEASDNLIGKELEEFSGSTLLPPAKKNRPSQVFRDCFKFLEEHLSDRGLDVSNLTNLKEDPFNAFLQNGLKERVQMEEPKEEYDLKSSHNNDEKAKLEDLVQLFSYNKSRDYGIKTLQDLLRSSRRRLDKANYYSPQYLKSVAYGSKNIYQKGNTPGLISSVLVDPKISFMTREPSLTNFNRGIKGKNAMKKSPKKTKGKMPISSLRESGQILHESIQHIENEITVIPVTRMFGNGKEEGTDKYNKVLKLPLSLICQEFYRNSGSNPNYDKNREDCDKVIRLSDSSNAIINLSELCKVMKNLSKSQKENNATSFNKKAVTAKAVSFFTDDSDYDYLDYPGLSSIGKSGNSSSNKTSTTAETTVIVMCFTSVKPIDTTTPESVRTTTLGTSSRQTTTGSTSTQVSTSASTPSTTTIKICLTTTRESSQTYSQTTRPTKNLTTTECTCEPTKQTTSPLKTTNTETTTRNIGTTKNSTNSTTPCTTRTVPQNESTWKRKYVALTSAEDWQYDKSTRNYQSKSTSPDSSDSVDFNWADWDAPEVKTGKQEPLIHPNMTLILKDFIPRHLKSTSSVPENDLKKYTLLIYKPQYLRSTPWTLQPANRKGVVIKNIRPIEKKYLSPVLKTRSPRMKKVKSTTKFDYDDADDYGDDAEDFDFNWKPTDKNLEAPTPKIIKCNKLKPKIILEPHFKEGKLTWQMGFTKFSRRSTKGPLRKSKYISKKVSEDLDSVGSLVPENSQSNLKSNSVNNDCLEERNQISSENETDEDYELECRSTDGEAEECASKCYSSEEGLISDKQSDKKRVFWASMVPKDDTNVIVVYVVNQNVTSLPNEIELKLQQDVDV